MHQRAGLNLPSSKPYREVLIEVLSFGFGVAVQVLVHLLAVLLIDGFSLVHTAIYDAHKQAHNQEKEINVLSLSSNRKQLRYRDRSNIIGRFPNGMTKTMLAGCHINPYLTVFLLSPTVFTVKYTMNCCSERGIHRKCRA